MKKIILILCIIILISLLLLVFKNKENKQRSDKMNTKLNININIDGIDYKASLENNDTSLELYDRLPLEITMNELNNNEKYYYFDKPLVNNPKKVSRVSAGDIMLFQDDCLVLFYESFNTNYSYTVLGKILDISSLDIKNKNDIKVIITKEDNNI